MAGISPSRTYLVHRAALGTQSSRAERALLGEMDRRQRREAREARRHHLVLRDGVEDVPYDDTPVYLVGPGLWPRWSCDTVPSSLKPVVETLKTYTPCQVNSPNCGEQPEQEDDDRLAAEVV